MRERWVGDWTDCNILTPSSSAYSSTSFLILLGCSTEGPEGPALCWELILTASNCNCNWLQLNQLSVAPGYIIVWCPPASCERRICTEFNPSTVKVISWYLRPDAPVSWLTAGSKVNMLHIYMLDNSFSLSFSQFLCLHIYMCVCVCVWAVACVFVWIKKSNKKQKHRSI